MNADPKTSEPRQLNPETAGEDNTFDLKIEELAEKAERGIPVEPEVKELVEEAKKNPKMMKKGFVQDAQKKAMLKKRFIFTALALLGPIGALITSGVVAGVGSG